MAKRCIVILVSAGGSELGRSRAGYGRQLLGSVAFVQAVLGAGRQRSVRTCRDRLVAASAGLAPPGKLQAQRGIVGLGWATHRQSSRGSDRPRRVEHGKDRQSIARHRQAPLVYVSIVWSWKGQAGRGRHRSGSKAGLGGAMHRAAPAGTAGWCSTSSGVSREGAVPAGKGSEWIGKLHMAVQGMARIGRRGDASTGRARIG